jgi:hypothetical protein
VRYGFGRSNKQYSLAAKAVACRPILLGTAHGAKQQVRRTATRQELSEAMVSWQPSLTIRLHAGTSKLHGTTLTHLPWNPTLSANALVCFAACNAASSDGSYARTSPRQDNSLQVHFPQHSLPHRTLPHTACKPKKQSQARARTRRCAHTVQQQRLSCQDGFAAGGAKRATHAGLE